VANFGGDQTVGERWGCLDHDGVIGCVFSLTKISFLKIVGNIEASFSFSWDNPHHSLYP